MNFRVFTTAFLTLAIFLSAQAPALAAVKIERSVTVNADLKTVWKALLNYQHAEKDFHKKVVSQNNHVVTIDEEFVRVPVVGSANILYIENNIPLERIDYKLQGSKVLTKFEGAWSIAKADGGTGTVVKLVTDIDSWVPVPFKNRILRKTVSKGMMKRLAYVKKQAENNTVAIKN